MDLNLNFSLEGGSVISGRRAIDNDPNHDVRTTPTSGKMNLSDGFVTGSGYNGGERVMLLTVPNKAGSYVISYDGISETFKGDRDPNVYALTKGLGGKDSEVQIGNLLTTDGGSGVSFASASGWSSLKGTTDGSNYFKTVRCYGLAVIGTDGKTTNVVALTDANKDSLQDVMGVIVYKVDSGTETAYFDQANPVTLAEALNSQPVYILEYKEFEAKSVKGVNSGEASPNKAPKAQEEEVLVDAAEGEDFTFDV